MSVQPGPATISVPSGGRVVVVADTHSRPHPSLGARLDALRPAAILHAGDIGEPSVLDTLGAWAPVVAVRGNIDDHTLPDMRVVELDLGGAALRLLLTHVALYGPKLRAEVAKAARDVGAPLVICGHSHVPFLGRDKGIAVFNPGSVGPRRFSLPILYGVLALGAEGVELTHHAVETGDAWMPG